MTIEDWRTKIDEIDDELLRLLNVRAELAIQVGESKRTAGLSIHDHERERYVVDRIRRRNRGPLDERAVVKLFRRIIQESRRAESLAVEKTSEDVEGVLR